MTNARVQLFVATFVVAVGLNFLWEMSQSALFTPMGGTNRAVWRCFVASLGDGAIIIAVVAIGALLFRRLDWFVRPGPAGYVFMAVFGAGVAIFIERWALSTGRWAYAVGMPLISVLNVGLVPVLQMMILPPLVFALAGRWRRAEENS